MRRVDESGMSSERPMSGPVTFFWTSSVTPGLANADKRFSLKISFSSHFTFFWRSAQSALSFEGSPTIALESATFVSLSLAFLVLPEIPKEDEISHAAAAAATPG